MRSILTNKLIYNHELVYEFLIVPVIEQDMIQLRSSIKSQYLAEKIDKEASDGGNNILYMSDLGNKLDYWENKDIYTSTLLNLMRNVGLNMRLYGKSNIGKTMYSFF